MNKFNLKLNIFYYLSLVSFLYFGVWNLLPENTEIKVLIFIFFFNIFSYNLGNIKGNLNSKFSPSSL